MLKRFKISFVVTVCVAVVLLIQAAAGACVIAGWYQKECPKSLIRKD
jgi:cyclic lactone autoinducer peptide